MASDPSTVEYTHLALLEIARDSDKIEKWNAYDDQRTDGCHPSITKSHPTKYSSSNVEEKRTFIFQSTRNPEVSKTPSRAPSLYRSRAYVQNVQGTPKKHPINPSKHPDIQCVSPAAPDQNPPVIHHRPGQAVSRHVCRECLV
jgi:hypothetical protein